MRLPLECLPLPPQVLVLTRVSAIACSATTAVNAQTSFGLGRGGFLFSYASRVTITDATLVGCSSDKGGAITNELSTMTISGTNITDSFAHKAGGAFQLLSGDLSITSSVVSNSTSSETGGCFDIDGVINWESTVRISESTITGCTGATIGVATAEVELGAPTLLDSFDSTRLIRFL